MTDVSIHLHNTRWLSAKHLKEWLVLSRRLAQEKRKARRKGKSGVTGTNPPPANPQKVKLAELAANLRSAVGTESTASSPSTGLLKFLSQYGCSVLNAGCFAAGTKLWTPLGYQNVEDLREGDRVYARNEFDPTGPIDAKPIEQVFRRFTEIVHLHLGGQLLRTTQEHPFYVFNQGWTSVSDLKQGDWLLTATGDWLPVEEVFYTGELEVVFNLRVADHHTYFVGDDGWGWSLWAHNLYSSAIQAILDEARKVPDLKSLQCVDLLEATELTKLLKGVPARSLVKDMTLQAFTQKLKDALVADQLVPSNTNVTSSTAGKIKNGLEIYGPREKSPVIARPANSTINPYDAASQEAHHLVFKRDVLDGKLSSGYYRDRYADIVQLINSTAPAVKAERFIDQLPAGKHEDRIAGLSYHLRRAQAYAATGELAEIEFPIGIGASEVDMLLSNGWMVDCKDWSYNYISGLSTDAINRHKKQILSYLNAQTDRGLRLEFSHSIPSFVSDLINQFQTDSAQLVYKDRLVAEVKS